MRVFNLTRLRRLNVLHNSSSRMTVPVVRQFVNSPVHNGNGLRQMFEMRITTGLVSIVLYK